MSTINKIKHLSFATKTLLLLVVFLFSILAFTYDTNEASALTCSYDGYTDTCKNPGECYYTGTVPSTCNGTWINCSIKTIASAVDGSTTNLQTCTCSEPCTDYGKTVSGAACRAVGWCDTQTGGTTCVIGPGAACLRQTSYSSGGSGGGGGPVTQTCPADVFDISTTGGSSFTTYMNEGVTLAYTIDPGTQKSPVTVATEIMNCPVGAVCSTKKTHTLYSWDDPVYNSLSVTPNTTAPGTYTVTIKAYDDENPGCLRTIDYSVTVKPSRKMVCDGGWYDIPPGDFYNNSVSSGPVALWNNGATNNDKYIKASYNGQQIVSESPPTYSSGNFSLKCVYNNGINDTCTWDMPGSAGFGAVYNWGADYTAIGATQSVTDSNNRTISVRRGGGDFQYSCSDAAPPPTGVCDGAWHFLPTGATPAQPVGIYAGAALDTEYSDAVVIAARETGGSATTPSITACRFNGTNECTWDAGWDNSEGGTTGYAPNLSLGWSLDFNIKTTYAGGEWVQNINRNSGWSGWGANMADNGVNWGQPFRTQDKLGRYWQFRNINDSVAYACGATPVCVTLKYDSTKSSISDTTLDSGDAFTVKCDYGVRGIDAVGVTTGGGATCAFSSWDNGNTSRTTANFNCTAGNVGGTFPVSCTDVSGTSDNICARSDTLGNITVTAGASATASITADNASNYLSIPYNSSATLRWDYSNASSCTITPPATISGYPSGNGSVSTGNLTADRTYSISCTAPTGSPAIDSVTVDVGDAPDWTLNVQKTGQGTVVGTSVPSQPNINCGSTCSLDFEQDTVVTLTATPANGRIFTGWIVQGGGSCVGTGSCAVTVSNAKTVIANFALNPNFIEF